MQDLENDRLNRRAGKCRTWKMTDQILHFPALQFGPSFSRSCIFKPCNLVHHFPGPAFSRSCIFSRPLRFGGSQWHCALYKFTYLLTYLLTLMTEIKTCMGSGCHFLVIICSGRYCDPSCLFVGQLVCWCGCKVCSFVNMCWGRISLKWSEIEARVNTYGKWQLGSRALG